MTEEFIQKILKNKVYIVKETLPGSFKLLIGKICMQNKLIFTRKEILHTMFFFPAVQMQTEDSFLQK